ncbi:MAG: sarcosine oxidase subunit gamma family protein [Xanthomonadales bacterium]|jgi:sarcosine oxidase subunit gamma|nr:sarcosine oxidase subunit gamma family protein [Xanthomonadales bacterium]
MTDRIPNPAPTGFEKGRKHAGLTSTGLDLCEHPPCGRVMLRTRLPAEDARTRVERQAGIELPVEPNTASPGEYPSLWTGPGRWLINARPADVPELRKQTTAALHGSTFLLSDISHARVVFDASGPMAPELLSRLCPLDLDECVFGTGRCAQSLLARIPMLLHRVNDEPCFHVYVDRSHAHYAWDWLNDAALSMGARGNSP